jgi:hypothetical protein
MVGRCEASNPRESWLRWLIEDIADRKPRALADGETLSLGKHAVKWLDAPHLPHGWECGYLMEERTRTLLCGDLFTQPGNGHAALIEFDILGPSEAFQKGSGLLRPRRDTITELLAKLAKTKTANAGLYARQRRGRWGVFNGVGNRTRFFVTHSSTYSAIAYLQRRCGNLVDMNVAAHSECCASFFISLSGWDSAPVDGAGASLQSGSHFLDGREPAGIFFAYIMGQHFLQVTSLGKSSYWVCARICQN